MRIIFCLVAVFMLLASTASADTFKLEYDNVFSGVAPSGTSPWLLATFTDAGANKVNLDVTAMNLTTGEFISALYFNNVLAPVGKFKFTVTGSQTGTAKSKSDAFKADGDGYYDILINFPDSADRDRFTNGETFYATLTGTGLTAASFDSLSVNKHGNGTDFISAAHIQGISDSDSDWDWDCGESESGWVSGGVVAPEPVSTILFIAGGSMLAMRRLRRK